MRIVCLLQVRDEVETGHLQRFLELNEEIIDQIYAFDDGSTDGTKEALETSGAIVISGGVRSFGRELETKNQLLTTIYESEPADTWIFRLDADEVCYASREELERECIVAQDAGYDAISFAHLNLWKSDCMARIDDHYNSFRPLRMWQVGSQAFFPRKSGLHVTSDPDGLDRVYESDAFPIVHYGFLTSTLIRNKASTYWKFGQRGYPLHRLLLDDNRRLAEVGDLVPSLGLRWDHSETHQCEIEEGSSHQSMIQFNALIARKDEAKPFLTIISLVYRGVDWLEMQYAEILKLMSEFPEGEVDYLFVANDATEDVITFLTENDINHVSFQGRANKTEWYINSVYRAYNFGVAHSRADHVLLVNSDMSYARGFLAKMYSRWDRKSLLVARLIERGRLESGELGVERDLGSHPSNFRRAEFEKLALQLSIAETAEGGLYMPLLVDKKTFLNLGGFPEGNLTPSGAEAYLKGQSPEYALRGEACIPGDQAFFALARTKGIEHKTAMDSLAYHFQEGEMSGASVRKAKTPKSGIWVVNDSIAGLNGEEVFWSSLVARLDSMGIRVNTVEAERPSNRWEDLTLPLRLATTFFWRGLRNRKPRLVFQNATYQTPFRALRTVALLQDRPRLMRLRWLQDLVLKFSSLTVTNDSKFFVAEVGRKMRWVPLPLADFWYSQIPSESRRVREKELPTAIFVGSFTSTKGWTEVKALVEKSVSLNWILVSKYPLPEEERELRSLPNVEVHSQVSPDELRSLYRRSHVLVCASPIETQHMASLEALSQGVRVVTTPVGHLGSFGIGEHPWGFVAKEISETQIRLAAVKSFDPSVVIEEVGVGKDHLWQLWISIFREELRKTFDLAGAPSRVVIFTGRVKSALLSISRRSRRKVIHKLVSLRSQVRKAFGS